MGPGPAGRAAKAKAKARVGGEEEGEAPAGVGMEKAEWETEGREEGGRDVGKDTLGSDRDTQPLFSPERG